MTTTDIEEIATIKVKEQVLKNNDCLRAFINENDKTPLWDGNIYVYSDEDKKMLNEISKKHEYEKDYIILSCIDILLENRFLFDEHYRLMKAKDKDLLKTFPIYNLINKVHISFIFNWRCN